MFRLILQLRTFALVVALTLVLSVAAAFINAPSGSARTPTSIDDVRVESREYQAALLAVSTAEDDIAWSKSQIRTNEHIIEQLTSGVRQLEAGLPTLAEKITVADGLVVAAKDDLADLAVLQYVLKGTDAELLTLTNGPADADHPAQRALVMDTAMAGHRATLDGAERVRDDAIAAVGLARNGKGDLETRLAAAHVALASAHQLLAETSSRLPDLKTRIDNERRRTRVIGSDLSYVALEAYLLGARAANLDNPGCALDWTILAGIGRVESRHGTYGGTSLDAQGNVKDPIIGIALDGSRNTAVVGDSDAGTLDGDATFDRAVGPMQFIPTTWAAYGDDGNRDGVSDPQNIYDAARAAGNYLCASGPIDDDDTLVHAILRYNASDAYVRAVRLNADRYSDLGITT